jgi:hypothetical protein
MVMFTRTHHERNQQLTVRPVEGLDQSFPSFEETLFPASLV